MKIHIICEELCGSPFNELPREFDYEYREQTKIRDLLLELSNKTKLSVIGERDAELIGHFSFVINGEKVKAKLDYPLYRFINNFELSSGIHIIPIWGYGIGGAFNFKEIARISMYANDHCSPHVHIYPIGNREKCIRINLNTLTQMKGDKTKFNECFNIKERKEIINFLKCNSEQLIEQYRNDLLGIYNEQDYIFVYEDNKYSFAPRRNY